MTQAIKPFIAGFMTCALIAACWFAHSLYSGTIQRGESMQDISDVLPPVVREMPVRKAQRDDVGRLLGGG